MWQAALMSRRLITLLLCIPAVLCCHAAMAWGNAGHRITGLIAAELLTPAARRQVNQLLGGEDLSVAATYMDTQRGALAERWPEAERWHYDNVPVCRPQAYCTDGHCATRQIERFRKVLADRSATREERALALRLLVHMLGDIHQPLHMADNHDRGGNQLYVRLTADGEPMQLHDLFDTVLVKQLQGSLKLKTYAQQLRTQYAARIAVWRTGTPDQWAQQTHLLARNRTYAELPAFSCNISSNARILTLTDAYLRSARSYLPEQLTKAGARIAFMLNAVLN